MFPIWTYYLFISGLLARLIAPSLGPVSHGVGLISFRRELVTPTQISKHTWAFQMVSLQFP